MMDVLEESLKKLKLPTLSDRLDGGLKTAAKQVWGYREFLEKIVAEEVSAKSHKRTEMGVWMARFPFVKTVEEFDFESQPSLDPKRIRELATSRSGKNLSGGGSGSGGDPKRLSDPLCGSPGPDRLPYQDAPGGAIGGEAQAALPVQASDHR